MLKVSILIVEYGKNREKKLTPVRRQYLRIKQKYPEAIVLFRLGDFYETFDEDAKLVSQVLEITLTSREMGKGQRFPMAGIPHHALNNYLARIVSLTSAYREADRAKMVPAPAMTPDESAEAGQYSDVPANGRANLRQILARYAVAHRARLQAVLKDAPESAKAALCQAIAVSAAGYEKALAATDG